MGLLPQPVACYKMLGYMVPRLECALFGFVLNPTDYSSNIVAYANVSSAFDDFVFRRDIALCSLADFGHF